LADKDGPDASILLLQLLEKKCDVYKVKSRYLDYNALLAIVPKVYNSCFVYSTSCFYGETFIELNATVRNVVSLLTVRLDNRAVVTLVYVNPSKVHFTEIGNPWLILGPYLDRVADLATGMLPYVIGDFNFDFPSRNLRSWQRQIRDNLEDRGYMQVNEATNLDGFQNDQVWFQNVDQITSMFILTKNDHTAIQGWLKG
jgi:hypothetical protein